MSFVIERYHLYKKNKKNFVIFNSFFLQIDDINI